MQVIIMESVEALAIQIERELIKHSCDAPVVDSILSCLHPIEVPSEAGKLVGKIIMLFAEAQIKQTDEAITQALAEAAALIESYGRRVPMKMLTEIFNNAVDWVPIGDSERVDEIAAKYGYRVE
jgi:hypothetical protein